MSPILRTGILTLGLSTLASMPPLSHGSELPPHRPLRILIVSDRVNPHNLPPEDLTEPGDISAALLRDGIGLNLDAGPDAVLEIPTDDIHLATTALSLPSNDPGAYDVLIYFAHRIPQDEGDAKNRADQDAFVAAVETFLQNGGGVIGFHHGLFTASGKDGILEILGARATQIAWNTIEGQNVINVGEEHFISRFSIEYPLSLSYDDPALGIEAGQYDAFNNTPDERYQTMNLNASVGEVDVLFTSDYNQNGTHHLLGYTHQREAWQGFVFAYQPGEYQPNALDDLDGNGFQILLNGIVYTSNACTDEALWANYGDGWPGTLGIPTLEATEPPVLGTSLGLSIGNSLGAPTTSVLFVGSTALSGTPPAILVGGLFTILALPLPTLGLELPVSIPSLPSLSGFSFFLQVLELDAGASQTGVSYSRGLELHIGC